MRLRNLTYGAIAVCVLALTLVPQALAQRKVIHKIYHNSDTCNANQGAVDFIEYVEGNTCNKRFDKPYQTPIYYKFVCPGTTTASLTFFSDSACTKVTAVDEVFQNECTKVSGSPQMSYMWVCEDGQANLTSAASGRSTLSSMLAIVTPILCLLLALPAYMF